MPISLRAISRFRMAGDFFPNLEPAGKVEIPVEAGMLIDRKGNSPISLTFEGTPRHTASMLPVESGTNLLNRIYQGTVTLADLSAFDLNNELATGDIQTADRISLTPSGDPEYYQSKAGNWHATPDGKQVNADKILIPGAFVIRRGGKAFDLPFGPPQIRNLALPPFGFREGQIGVLPGTNFGPAALMCVRLRGGGQHVTFHVVETTSERLVYRVGKIPPGFSATELLVMRGDGLHASIDTPINAVELLKPVKTLEGTLTSQVTLELPEDEPLEAPIPGEEESRFSR